MKKPFTKKELSKFDRLTMATSDRDQMKRISARLELDRFIKEHGKEKCDAMFAVLTKQQPL